MQCVDDGSVLLSVDSMALDNAAAASGFVGILAPHATAMSGDIAASRSTAGLPKRPARGLETGMCRSGMYPIVSDEARSRVPLGALYTKRPIATSSGRASAVYFRLKENVVGFDVGPPLIVASRPPSARFAYRIIFGKS